MNNSFSLGTQAVMNKIEEISTDETDLLIVFNVYTLVRNVIKDNKNNILKNKEILDIVNAEIFNIEDICNSLNVNYVFLLPEYGDLFIKLNKDKKSNIKSMAFHKRIVGISTKIDVKCIKNIANIKAISYLVSHISIDLTMIKDVRLIESYTGEIINSINMHKKFKRSTLDLSNIPFNIQTLNIFGDNHIINPLPLKDRKGVLLLAINQKWNKLTKEEIIKNQLEEYKSRLVIT